MGKLLKIFFSVASAVILLIIAAMGVLLLLVDPNDFKPEIEAAVEKNTGRVLTISGDLELSIFPWLGFSTGKLSLSNASSFKTKSFLEIEESNIKVKLLPLMAKQIEVSRIVFKGLKLNLQKNSQGNTNWDDLMGAEQDGEESHLPVFAALAISGISLQNAQIIWDDQQSGQHFEIKELTLNTDRLAFNEPIGIALSFTLHNNLPEFTEGIEFTTDVVVNEQLDIIQLDKVDLQSTTAGEVVPGGKLIAHLETDIHLNLREQVVNLSGFQLSAGDTLVKAEITGKNLHDAPRFTGPVTIVEQSPRKLMHRFNIDVPPMQDNGAFDRIAVQFELNATTDAADLEHITINFDDTTIKGTAKIKNYAQPAISFALNGDTMDADRYFPKPTTAKLPSAATQTSQAVVSPDAAVTAGVNMFPVETLRKLNVNGTISIGKLKVNNLLLQDISLQLKAKDGIVRSGQTVKQLYRGTYSGSINIDARNKTPEVTLSEQMSDVQLGPLLRDLQGKARMTGRVNATAKLNARGNNSRALKASLNGTINFLFSDGVILGFNLQKIIDDAKSIIKGTGQPSPSENDQTEYDIIKASARVVNGLIINNDLFAQSSSLRVNGKGSADLPSEKLDYKVTAKIIRKEATATEPEKIEVVPVIIDVDGSFSKPSYTLNLKEMIPEKTKQKLFDKIDKELGPGVSDFLKRFL